MRLRPELVPYLAIGAFAGVRRAELLRLHWSEVDWQSRLIEIKGAKAKTAGRRHVPISENLLVWLLPFRERTGLVCDDGDAQGHLRAVVERQLVEGDLRRKALRGSLTPFVTATAPTGCPSSRTRRNSHWKWGIRPG